MRRFYFIILVCAIALLALAVFPASSTAQAAKQTDNSIKIEAASLQILEGPFRLVKTQNIWTQLLLDTRDGRVWQVMFAVDKNGFRGKVAINDKPLVSPAGKVGRFTLEATDNMWNFLLLDSETGNVWQCQFSINTDDRFLSPLLSVNDEIDQELEREVKAALTPEEYTEYHDSKTTSARRKELIDKLKKAATAQWPNGTNGP